MTAARQILLFTHPDCEKHSEGYPYEHIESPMRLVAVVKALRKNEALDLVWREPRMATQDELFAVHDPRMIETVLMNVPSGKFQTLDADTILSEDSHQAILRAAGACVEAVNAVFDGPVNAAFCAIRPPGHHATPKHFGGFCLVNNVAVGVAAALKRPDVKRVGILDIDVHHGNGTQDTFWNEPRVMFTSIHQTPHYPYSGAKDETGQHNNIVNAPIFSGTSGKEWLRIVKDKLLSRLEDFAPDLIFVSAGFDAHEEDPLGGLDVTDQDYKELGHMIRETADRTCQGRVIFALEGGYNLDALGRATCAVLEGFSE